MVRRRRKPFAHAGELDGVRATQALAPLLVALLIAPGSVTAQGNAEDAEAAALAPLQVALRDLPDIIRQALNESARRLISDEAQARLAEELDYVRGFSELPPGGGALREADVRDAYSWLEAVVETVAGIPGTFDDSQNAGATCRAAFAGVPANDPPATVKLGLDAVDRLGILRAELESLLQDAPSILDVQPLAQAVALVEGYWTEVAPDIVDCLERLLAESQQGSVARVPLKAVVLPATTFPTGHVRVLGTAPTGLTIKVMASSLSVAATPSLLKGGFKQPITAPRTAALANHTITVTAADLRVDLVLNVAKAPVRLSLSAPDRVTADLAFTATVTVSSPASPSDVDRVPVRLTWRGQDRSLPLANGSSSARLDAGAVGDFVLRADYPGSSILAGSSAERIVHVATFVPVDVDPAGSNPRIPAGFNGLPSSAVDWFWWILILILAVGFGLALYMSPVALHRLRGTRSNVILGSRPPPRWPGAATLAAAVGALFGLLRRLHIVPPGRTVQEWMRETKGPAAIADKFDAVRYGGAVETEATKAQGVTWAQAAWERWAKR